MSTKRALVVVAGLALLAGCAGNRPIKGLVSREPSSMAAKDFTFLGPDNRPHRFSEMAYGSVAVLAIVDESKGEPLELARRLDALAVKYAYDGVEVFLVTHSNPAEMRKEVCIVERTYGSKRLNILCDQTGKVRDAYGVKAPVEYLVIDDHGRLAGRTTGETQLAQLIDKAVAAHAASAQNWIGLRY